jgi:hypothetical protein
VAASKRNFNGFPFDSLNPKATILGAIVEFAQGIIRGQLCLRRGGFASSAGVSTSARAETEGIPTLPEIHNSMSSLVVWETIIASPFVGSFLGVAIRRLPAGRPIALGRSECDVCRHSLGPLDLIPFFSWVGLRGRCRHCGATLPVFYPLIELAALIVAIWAATTASGLRDLLSCLVGWTLLAVGVTGWRERRSVLAPGLALAAWLVFLYAPDLIFQRHLR